jgi:hypothetical protein
MDDEYEELETMLANLKRAYGLLGDVDVAAEKLADSQPMDALRECISGAVERLDQAFVQMRTVLGIESAAPAPDWSTAPEEAEWWAVDEDEGAFWYDEPKPYLLIAGRTWSADGHFSAAGFVALNGTDWRTTLRQRPQAVSA